MRVNRMMNQQVAWHRKTGQDRHHKAIYAPNATIACRFEHDRRLVRSRDGTEVMSEAAVYTQAKVSLDDAITDPSGRRWTIIAVNIETDGRGKEKFREVRL